MRLLVTGEFVGLRLIAVEQVTDALRDPRHRGNRMGRNLRERLGVGFDPACDGLGHDIDVGGLGNLRQRCHFPHPDSHGIAPVGRKIAESAGDDVVVHQPVDSTGSLLGSSDLRPIPRAD